MKKLTTFIVLVALVVVGYFMWPELRNAFAPTEIPPVENELENGGQRIMSIEDYVRMNISELSPEKEVLGGTFYVTNIEAANGKGVVSYEDGHIALTADFTYTTDIERGHTINSFVVRPQ